MYGKGEIIYDEGRSAGGADTAGTQDGAAENIGYCDGKAALAEDADYRDRKAASVKTVGYRNVKVALVAGADACPAANTGKTGPESIHIALLAIGSMVSTAEHIRDKLKSEGYKVTLANGRFVKPVDYDLTADLASRHDYLVTLEENVLQGGYGLQITAWAKEHAPRIPVLNIALPDAYVEHGNVSLLREMLGIDSDSIIRKMKAEFGLQDTAEAEDGPVLPQGAAEPPASEQEEASDEGET